MTPAHETSSHGIPHVYWSVVRTFAQHTDVANLLWDAFGVAVNAFDGMDIVRALGRFESRIHGFDIQAAIRELWMAGGARRTSVLSVSLVAGVAGPVKSICSASDPSCLSSNTGRETLSP